MPSRLAVNGASPRILAITDDPSILALFQDLQKVEGYHISIRVYVDHDLTEITTLTPNLIILDCVGTLEDPSWTLLLVPRTDPVQRMSGIAMVAESLRRNSSSVQEASSRVPTQSRMIKFGGRVAISGRS